MPPTRRQRRSSEGSVRSRCGLHRVVTRSHRYTGTSRSVRRASAAGDRCRVRRRTSTMSRRPVYCRGYLRVCRCGFVAAAVAPFLQECEDPLICGVTTTRASRAGGWLAWRHRPCLYLMSTASCFTPKRLRKLPMSRMAMRRRRFRPRANVRSEGPEQVGVWIAAGRTKSQETPSRMASLDAARGARLGRLATSYLVTAGLVTSCLVTADRSCRA